MRRFIPALLVSGLAAACCAQSDLVGKGQYPQFRTLSGLSGCGFGVLLDGTPSFDGAMALSTPIAQSLSAGRVALGAGDTSSTYYPRFLNFDPNVNSGSLGKAEGMFGLGTPFGNFTIGGMILSTKFDSAESVQFTPKLGLRNIDLGLGVQDVFDHAGENGQDLDNKIGLGNSRSFYGVVTAKYAPGGYISVGTGSQRFNGVFGNTSYNLLPWLKGVVEYDTFNWNYGVGLNLGHFAIGKSGPDDEDRYVNTTAFLGFVRGKYATWAIVMSF